jgi:hypothetical protein
MPRPPRVEILDQMKFITGYWWQGCETPFNLIVEFSRAPTGRLLALVLGLDANDIIKEWLRPARGRKRTPRRHGRKRPLSGFSFDLNDYIAGKPRAAADGYPGLDLPGSRALFKITDVADRVNMTAAIVEGVSDVGFETLWGIINLNPDFCPTMPFVNRSRNDPLSVPGVVSPGAPLPAPILLNAQHYVSTGPNAYRTFVQDTNFGWSGIIKPYSIGGCVNWTPTVRSTTRGVIGQGSSFTLDQDELGHFTCNATVQAGEIVFPARTTDFGSVEVLEMSVYGFGGPTW